MKRTTKKLTGIGLELFLRRFYGTYADIDEKLADQLSKDGAQTFASVRVRHIAWRDWRPRIKAMAGSVAKVPDKRDADAAVAKKAPATPSQSTATASAAPEPTAGDVPFDPYAIGLVPVYQREGAEGLSEKLATIGSLDNLRKMARSQQVALPAELRGSDADITSVRAAIVSAVGKRIANRRAAAG